MWKAITFVVGGGRLSRPIIVADPKAEVLLFQASAQVARHLAVQICLIFYSLPSCNHFHMKSFCVLSHRRPIFSLSFLFQRERASCRGDSVSEVRRRKMVQAVLWLRGRKYLDADVHGSVFRLWKRNVLLQVRNVLNDIMRGFLGIIRIASNPHLYNETMMEIPGNYVMQMNKFQQIPGSLHLIEIPTLFRNQISQDFHLYSSLG